MLDFINGIFVGFIVFLAIRIWERIADGAKTIELRNIAGFLVGLGMGLMVFMGFQAAWQWIGLPPPPARADGHPHTFTNMLGAVLGALGLWITVSIIKNKS